MTRLSVVYRLLRRFQKDLKEIRIDLGDGQHKSIKILILDVLQKRLVRGKPETRLMTRIGPHDDERVEGKPPYTVNVISSRKLMRTMNLLRITLNRHLR